MKTYQSLCTQYYDIDKPYPPAEEMKFYLSYAERAKGLIFEPMCGSGRLLIPLLEKGYNIEGADPSEHMLAACEEKCLAKGLKPKLTKEYLHQMRSDKQYALIFIPTGSFGLIIEPSQAKACLKILYDHLLPGGKLVFEVETIQAVPNLIDRHQQKSISSVTREDGAQIRLATSSTFDQKSQIVHAKCDYELVRDSQVIGKETEEMAVRYYQHNEMDEWLKPIGFSNIERYKTYEFVSPNLDDEMIVYECTK